MKNTKISIYNNRKAYFDYTILDEFIAGIALKGFEIKSIRDYKCSLAGSYAHIENNECFVVGMHIDRYGNQLSDPQRDRKLLLTKKEIRYLKETLDKNQGQTLIPLEVIIERGHAKLILALAAGKKKHDKRNALKEKQMVKEIKG